MAYNILVIDDEALTLRTISRALRDEGFDVSVAMTGEDGLKVLQEERPELALLDVVLPGIDGIEVLRQFKQKSPNTIVVMMSAYRMVDRAVEAMKLGAYDFLIKPFHLADMVNTIRRASEMLSLRVRLQQSVETAKGRYDFGRIVTNNPTMATMLEVARKTAEMDRTTILIQGESGTGKSVLARAIHYNSPRATQELLELNCASLPETLLESEMFGYEPGAFTDARRRKEGLIERANAGTLFLDEIGNLPLHLQPKLLTALEQRMVTPVGANKAVPVDIRVIAATNMAPAVLRDPRHFRQDLLFRLNTVEIELPPLRERREDVAGLVEHYLSLYAARYDRAVPRLAPGTLPALAAADWPGNVRALRHAVERAVILGGEAPLLPQDFGVEPTARAIPAPTLAPAGADDLNLDRVERRLVETALRKHGYNISAAAAELGLSRAALYRRLEKHGL